MKYTGGKGKLGCCSYFKFHGSPDITVTKKREVEAVICSNTQQEQSSHPSSPDEEGPSHQSSPDGEGPSSPYGAIKNALTKTPGTVKSEGHQVLQKVGDMWQICTQY